jgi:hypothetical protein
MKNHILNAGELQLNAELIRQINIQLNQYYISEQIILLNNNI